MKRLTLFAILTSLFLATTLTVSAQTVATWIQPRNVSTNQTLLLGQNQVMEVLSLLIDRSTSVDITIDERTVTLGAGGIDTFAQGVVVAGPATVVMRRTSGHEGSMMTFRVVQIEKPVLSVGQTSPR